MIEADAQGSVPDEATPVDVGRIVPAIRRGMRESCPLSVDRGQVHAEVPLSDACGLVSVSLQQRRHGQALRLDEMAAVSPQHPRRDPRPPAVATGEDAVAGRRAERRRRVGIAEVHALASDAVDVRGRNLRIGVEIRQIPVSHVVGEHEHDVGSVGARRPRAAPSGPRRGGGGGANGLEEVSSLHRRHAGLRVPGTSAGIIGRLMTAAAGCDRLDVSRQENRHGH